MTSYFISGIYSFFTSVSKLWQKETIKRRRDSFDEDEEEDLIDSCRTLSKRPKWMTNPYTSTVKMTESVQHPQSSSRSKTPVLTVKVPIKKNFHQRLKPLVKENGAEFVEVIELESNNVSSASAVEARPPLADLSVRPKTKQHQHQLANDVTYLGSSSRPHRDHSHVRKQNGVHPSLMNHSSSMEIERPPRPSQTSRSRHTSLDEIFQIDQKLKYSQLLADYHKSSSNCATSERSPTGRGLSNFTSNSASCSRPVATVDLTVEDRRSIHVKVKPYKSSAVGSGEEEVQILEERPVVQVNSLEKKLSQNSLISPQWILEMKQKYSEKEREKLRQVEEEKLKKELYAKHNQSKRLEQLDARIRNHLKITDIVLDDTEDVLKLPEITPEMNEKINAALKPNPSSEVLVRGFNLNITRLDMQTLNKLNWLNDEVINFYFELINERAKEENRLKVYAFNTFLYTRLQSHGFNLVKRWTRKKLLKYLCDESMDKKKEKFDTSKWKLENVKDIPQQMNGSDCGMFSCMFAEYLSRNAKFTFSQRDMPYFRRKMVYEILTKKLLQ